MELEKLIALGERLGLSDEKLREFVAEREKAIQKSEQEKREREDRAAERDARRAEMEMEMKMRKGESDSKLAIMEKEIELARITSGEQGSETKLEVGKTSEPRYAKLPKLPVFDDKKDCIDAYLQRFERFAENAKWDKGSWSINLSALLAGTALEVYSRLSPVDALNYDVLKIALLQRFRLTEEGFHNKFRNSKPENGENPAQFAARLDNYLTRWMQLASAPETFQGLKDLMLREQFLGSSSKMLATFIKERHPKDINEMTRLAELFIEAHGFSVFNKPPTVKSEGSAAGSNPSNTVVQKPSAAARSDRKCYVCGKVGHLARNCFARKPRNPNQMNAALIGNSSSNETQPELNQMKNAVGGMSCHEKAENYQNRDGYVGSLCVQSYNLQDCCVQNSQVTLRCGHVLPFIGGACQICHKMPIAEGFVGPSRVQVLRDTGCSGVVVKRDLVKQDQMTGKSIECVLIDGTVRRVPEANIEIDTPFFSGTVKALCMGNPVYDLIVGNIEGAKGPNEFDLVCKSAETRNKSVSSEQGYGVQTRNQAKKSKEAFKKLQVANIPELDITVDDMKSDQKEDSTLDNYRSYAVSRKRLFSGRQNVSWFAIENGLLYRFFQSPSVGNKIVKQLVVPTKRRNVVLRLAHECVLSGHLGVKKTVDRVLPNFYWPGIQGDIKRFCQSCDVCQRTVPKGRVTKIPLGSMPLIDIPFERVAVDIVGPIHPVTERGNRYILTLVDYSTRYPEAVPLKSIETERVAEALFEMFTRVGIPKEILSDMGAQFTSSIMKEVGRLLSIKQLHTTPYNPACNGLVEKFNGTIKLMLKRMTAERPKDWDRYIAPLLFAYREVPLLYGRTVRGPMSVLREIWTNEICDPEIKSTYQYVLDLKERLSETCEMAKRELQKSSARYKKYYDRKTKPRSFSSGDKALILLPTDHNKLLMQWKGPYPIVGKVGVADYKINVHGKVKTFHANLLKKYVERETRNEPLLFCAVVEPEIDTQHPNLPEEYPIETIPLLSKESYDDVHLNDRLDDLQKREISELLEEFQDVISDIPKRTSLVQHEINLTTTPVRNRPYNIPFALRDTVRDEVKKMLEMDIIEPSESPYASSIVVAKKSDGSNRICIDFRNLNKITIFDAEPMPDPEEIFAKLGQSKYFTKIDLSKGYWQIPLRKQDRDFTSFISPDGLFRFKVMPFGLSNAAATFNRMMRILLRGLKNIDSFIDDILIHTATWAEHLSVLRDLFERLRASNLVARPSKCFVAYDTLEFLGHSVGNGAIMPNAEKLKAIQDALRPETKKQLRSFLGLIGFYRKFVPNFAMIAVPLTDMTKKRVPHKITWGTEQENAFRRLKSMLLFRPILRLPDFSRTFYVRTDASEYGLGAVLLQEHEGDKLPIAYASKKLNDRERAYAVIEKECLAIVWGVTKFQVYLYGRCFVLETDHQPLTYLNKSKVTNGRLMRWALFLQSYSFVVLSIKGIDNIGADFLSRHVA